MDHVIRAARRADKASIAAFASDTFVWGDYVLDAFDAWLDNSAGCVLVATGADDEAIALAYGVMLSPTEAWLQGARVHPEWRRRGIAGALDQALEDWVRSRGGTVARLLIEDDNGPARLQVAKIGYRAVSDWVRAERSIGDASPVTAGNGGRRVAALEQLNLAHGAEAEPAYLAWSSGELSRASRGLFGLGWRFRRLTIDDLRLAARHESLWAARSGWALAAKDQDEFEVSWVETARTDATDLARGIVDLALDQRAERLEVWIPAVDWLVSAFRQAGCEAHHMAVYEKGL